MDRFTAFLSTASASTAAAAPPTSRTPSALADLGWPDDWTPEASGIFRIFKREPSRTAEVTADAAEALPPEDVPLPRGRPVPGDVSAPAFAFAPEDR
jgi:hypothetical protein